MQKNSSFRINTNTLPYWAKVLLLCAMVLNSSSMALESTIAAWQASDEITGNTVSTGIWSNPAATTTIVVTGNTAGGENQPGWLFNRDQDTQSPYEFNTDASVIGNGSLFVEPIANNINGNSDKFIAELFLLEPIADFSRISYDFNIATNDAGDADQFYMNLYTNFGTSSPTKYYDCRYDIAPTTSALNDWTTLSINPSTGVVTGGSIVNVAQAGSSPYACPATPAGMDALSADSVIRAVAITVGDTSASDAGVSGYLDNVIVTKGSTTTIYDFESLTCEAGPGYFDTFTLDSVHNQQGWSSSGPFDQEVVTNSYGFPTFGCQSLRISNAVTSGSFGDQTFSYSAANEAGETDAENDGQSGGTRQTVFEAEFDLATALPDHQPGLVMSVSPDRGDGARMSWLSFTDTADGVDVQFADVQTVSNPADWTYTTVADNLSRSVPHTIKFEMEFVEGPGNDIVKIYIDGILVHTGTSWENYYRYDDESNPTLVNESRTVDSLLFRVSSTAVPANSGKGFLVDNVLIETSGGPAPEPVMATDGDVVLNEFLPNTPDDNDDMPNGEWVELYNNENFDIDLTDWYITDASGGMGNRIYINSTNAPTHILSATTTIEANSFLVVYMNKPILNNPGDTVKLYNGLEQLKDSYSYGADPTHCENIPTPGSQNVDNYVGEPDDCDDSNVPEGKSFARFIDGTGPWVDPEPTPGEENRFSRQDLIDSGFSPEMIEGMVALLASRGEYLIGEEPALLEEAAESIANGEEVVETVEGEPNVDSVGGGSTEIQEEGVETEENINDEPVDGVVEDTQEPEAVGPNETAEDEVVEGEVVDLGGDVKKEEDVEQAETIIEDEMSEEPTADEEVVESEEETEPEAIPEPDPEPEPESEPEVVTENA